MATERLHDVLSTTQQFPLFLFTSFLIQNDSTFLSSLMFNVQSHLNDFSSFNEFYSFYSDYFCNVIVILKPSVL